MGYSRIEYPYNGGDQDFPINFALGFLKTTDIQVYVQGEVDGLGDTIFRSYTFLDAGTIRVTDPITAGSTVIIERTVSKNDLEISVDNTGAITRVTLTRAFKQLMMNIHELLDGRVDSFSGALLDAILALRDEMVVLNAATTADAVSTAADRVAVAADRVDTTASALAAANSATAASTSATSASNSVTAVAEYSAASIAARDASVVAKDLAVTASTTAQAAATSASASASTATTQAGVATTQAAGAGASATSAATSADHAALYDGPQVDEFSGLAGIAPTDVTPGGYVIVRSIGAVYERVMSGGDLDYSGVGGVEFNIVLGDLRAFGSASDGSTNDASILVAALSTGSNVAVPPNTVLEPTLAQVPAIIEGLNRVLLQSATTIQLPSGEAAVTQQVQLENAQLHNLTLKGPAATTVTATAVVNTTDTPKDHRVRYTLSDATECVVGEYLYIGYAVGTGAVRSSEGCWKITAISGNDVTVKHALAVAWPTMTMTAARIIPIKSTLRWPNTQRGVAVMTTVGAMENLVIAGSFDSATTAGEDSYSDGMQIGPAPDQLNTGSTESQQINAGALYAKNLHLVEWLGNGIQNHGGNFYGFQCTACANGWRGFQSTRNGSMGVKASSAIGNGQSGYETEEGGDLLANNSVAAGNGVQGVYGIGFGSIGFQNGVSENNLGAGIDVRNGALVLADGATVSDNADNGIYCVSGKVIFGNSATSSGNTTYDVFITEGGLVNAAGASSLGVKSVDHDGGGVLVDTDASLFYSNTLKIKDAGTARGLDILVTSAGDALFRNVDGSTTTRWVMKSSGVLHPSGTGETIGRSANPVSAIYATSIVMKSPDGTTHTVTMANGGTLTVS